MAKLGKDSALTIDVNKDGQTIHTIRCQSKEMNWSSSEIDVTDDGSTNKEYLPGYSEISFSISGVWQDDAGHRAIEDAYQAGQSVLLTLTTAEGHSYTGEWTILGYTRSFGLDEGQQFSFDLKAAGSITLTRV